MYLPASFVSSDFHRFRDRHEAGRILASKLLKYQNDDPLVCALPRGGVVLGFEIAKNLHAPLQVIVTQKNKEETHEMKSSSLTNKTVILVDEGVATGKTLESAIKEIKTQKPKKIIVAVPVAPQRVAANLRSKVYQFEAILIPPNYLSNAESYYEEFDQVDDAQVKMLVSEANK